jgi:thymidylate kinase
LIICLEGINGCGKSTLAAAVAEAWKRQKGCPAAVVEPVQLTAFGRAVRTAIMQEPTLEATAETLAFASARMHACRVIRAQGSEAANKLVILERWVGAVVAYGRVAGTDEAILLALEASLGASLPMRGTFVLDVPGAVAAARLGTTSGPNKFETRGDAYLDAVGKQYGRWAEDRNVPVLAGHGHSVADLVELVLNLINA